RVGTAQAGRDNYWACRVAPPLEAVCPNAAPSLCPPSWLRSFPLTLDLSPILARSSMWLDRGMAARSCAASDAAAAPAPPLQLPNTSGGKGAARTPVCSGYERTRLAEEQPVTVRREDTRADLRSHARPAVRRTCGR